MTGDESIAACQEWRAEDRAVRVQDLRVKIFADGANLEGIKQLRGNPVIRGITTNPTLMRQAGINDYERFARDLLAEVSDMPISFEVIASEHAEMQRQAKLIASWGPTSW